LHSCFEEVAGFALATGLPRLSSQLYLQPSEKPVHPQKKPLFPLIRRRGFLHSGQGGALLLMPIPALSG
jgi:hypothetical protein